MSYLISEPIKKGDVVKVGEKTGLDGVIAVVIYVNNLKAIATVEYRRSRKDVHVSKLTLLDRPLIQRYLPL